MIVSLPFLDKLVQQQDKLFAEQIISCFVHWVAIQDLTLEIIFHTGTKPWIISKSTEADTLRIRTEYYELTTSRSLDLPSFVMIISFIFTLLI